MNQIIAYVGCVWMGKGENDESNWSGLRPALQQPIVEIEIRSISAKLYANHRIQTTAATRLKANIYMYITIIAPNFSSVKIFVKFVRYFCLTKFLFHRGSMRINNKILLTKINFNKK